ncbi:peptidase m15b and m15c dd-carboxypeptidase vany/endolysin [Pseudomonas knackmussii B13]|uniref:Peptidase m15b and m15c dd-carboxypeptidase vany/endolysin n=1 Tax=Pseudomonas knackmussii (strain DSM 6978 / CCUG 54928 / LMG 23759 / B13) TaxID=1301098 RepID=A0A024HHB1_PSEKB|nr:M15 family metallopeptidase [Pseudomonas knackmussii]CDF84271.1 peptidase m15b and m15c dd-carboxypeptidase vany/endolysin [Pseudomonas knackmussii B13]
MEIEAMISAVQTALGIDVDGRAGPQTWGAIYTKIVGPLPAEAEEANISAVDPRSETLIATLLPEVRPYARALVQKATAAGIRIKVISALRTYAEQDQLYAQGRTAPGTVVTNAKAGQSNHNFGIAFDVGVFEGNKYLGDSPKYKAVGALGIELGLEWGGNWKSIVDQPHFQLRPTWAAEISERDMLAELRKRKADGRAVYA